MLLRQVKTNLHAKEAAQRLDGLHYLHKKHAESRKLQFPSHYIPASQVSIDGEIFKIMTEIGQVVPLCY